MSDYFADIIGFCGLIIGILWPTLLSQIGILSFVDTFASFFGPISGVMIVNYYLIHNSTIKTKDIHISFFKILKLIVLHLSKARFLLFEVMPAGGLALRKT